MIIVIGHSVGELSKQPAAIEIGAIHRSLANCYGCQSVVGSGPVLEFVLVGGAVALVLPILILIATASRLSAVRHEERFASMRLVGATPRQISTISAVEAAMAALAGVVLGFGLFFAVRPMLYHVPFTGAPLAQGDLSLHAIDVLIVVVGVPVAAIVSAPSRAAPGTDFAAGSDTTGQDAPTGDRPDRSPVGRYVPGSRIPPYTC